MAELVAEQVTAALRTKLAAIVADGGANFWLTPTAVARADNWAAWEPEWLDPATQTTAYIIRGGDGGAMEHAAQSYDKELELFVLGATRYTPSTLNPFQQGGTLGQTLQNRMIRDVERAISQDVTLGVSGVINTEVTDEGRATPYVEGWAVVLVRVKCTFNVYYLNP